MKRPVAHTFVTKNEEKALQLYLRAGHPSDKVLKLMLPNETSSSIKISDISEKCITQKMCRKVIPYI